jgi:hypothetical protein
MRTFPTQPPNHDLRGCRGAPVKPPGTCARWSTARACWTAAVTSRKAFIRRMRLDSVWDCEGTHRPMAHQPRDRSRGALARVGRYQPGCYLPDTTVHNNLNNGGISKPSHDMSVPLGRHGCHNGPPSFFMMLNAIGLVPLVCTLYSPYCG